MISHERSGWRDEAISRRHREFGHDVPAMDLDFILCEYDYAKPKALIEHKNEFAKDVTMSNIGIRTLNNLAEMAGLPAFCVRYATNFSWYKVVPLNDKAKEFIPKIMLMDEKGYVELLYKIRGKEVPEEIINFLKEKEGVS